MNSIVNTKHMKKGIGLFFLFFLICNTGILAISPQSNRFQDSLTLVKLYTETQGTNWVIKWNLQTSINNWHGVSLDGTGCVSSLVLNSNNLNGPLPNEISNLTNVRYLNFNDNKLSGTIPTSIGSLSNLEDLILDDNLFAGILPSTIGNLSKLRTISLRHNLLTGEIPLVFYNLTNLNSMALSRNSFYGTIHSNISRLSKLSYIDLSNNLFEGTLPSSIGQLILLSEIYIQNNRFKGELPSSMSSLVNLRHFWANDNGFSGSIPDLRNSKLISLKADHNQFTEIPDLSTINTWGSTFPFGLDIRYNKFTFEDLIPLRNFPSQYLYLYDPQDSIYIEKMIYIPQGSNYNIKLYTDPSIPDNNYKWFKDTSLVFISNHNEYQLIQVTEADEGIYSGVISNAIIPGFEIPISKSRVIITDPEKCNKPIAGTTCHTAASLCGTTELHNYCGNLGLKDTTIIHGYLCDSSLLLDNPRWISFVATADSMLFEIFPINCSSVVTEGNTFSGLQASISTGCDSNREVLYCMSDCSNDPFILGGNGFQIGERYFITLDGCAGSVCEYLIKVIEGNSVFRLTQPSAIQGDQAFCPDSASHLFSIKTIPGAEKYQWFVNDTFHALTLDSQIVIKNFASGIYQLKVRALNNCDTTLFSSILFQVFSKMEAKQLNISKEGKDSVFMVACEIQGGNPPYRIISGNGNIDSLTGEFYSQFILCNNGYRFVIADRRNCQLTIEGFESCGCGSFAGIIPNDTLQICEGSNFSTGAATQVMRDSGDVSAYILFSDTSDIPGSVVKYSTSGIFAYDPIAYRFDSIYYIAHVVSRPNHLGQINLLHPCVSISNYSHVVFRQKPIVSTGPNLIFCGYEGEINAFGNYTSGIWKILTGGNNLIIDSALMNLTKVFAKVYGTYTLQREVFNLFCSSQDDLQIVFRDSIETQITGYKFVCSGQTTSLDAGENFSEYSWSNGEKTRYATIAQPGDYCVTVVDENRCVAYACAHIDSSTAPFPVLRGPDSLCTRKEARITISQTFPQYIWNTFDTSSSLLIDSGGLYCVTVTATNGCKGTDCIYVETKQPGYAIVHDTACFDSEYFYLGKTYKVPGSYEVFLNKNNYNNCDSIVLLELSAFRKINIIDTIISPDLGSGNGSISVLATGGVSPLKYKWNTGQTTPFISQLIAGKYTLTITDGKACVIVLEFVVSLQTDNHEWLDRPSFKIIPNPSSQFQTVTMLTSAEPGTYEISIWDFTGKKLERQIIELNSANNQIPLGSLPEYGMFIIKLENINSKKSAHQKIIRYVQ